MLRECGTEGWGVSTASLAKVSWEIRHFPTDHWKGWGSGQRGQVEALSMATNSRHQLEESRWFLLYSVFIRKLGNYFKQFHNSSKSLLYRSIISICKVQNALKIKIFQKCFMAKLKLNWHEGTYNYLSNLTWIFRNFKVSDNSCLKNLKYYITCHICIFLNFPKIKKILNSRIYLALKIFGKGLGFIFMGRGRLYCRI